MDSEKRTPDEWSRAYGVRIYSWDGWNGADAPGRDEPITLAEYGERLTLSTASHSLAGSERMHRDLFGQ